MIIQSLDRNVVSNNKIDFLLVCHPKDFCSLKLAVNSIKNNITCCKNIYVISEENLNLVGTIFVPENQFDSYISKELIRNRWLKKNRNLSHRAGWLDQQFLKLYAGKVIVDLTDSFVFVDSDTIFLRDIEFNPNLFSYVKVQEYHKPYLNPIKILLNKNETIGFSCISHHMIFQKEKVNNLIKEVETRFNLNFVDAILNIIDYNESSCFSEWDLYANYMILNNPTLCKKRQLKWKNISYIPSGLQLAILKLSYDFVSCHAWMRGGIK
jgi:hypothetical protein